MNKTNLIKKLKDMSKYIDVNIDKEFALEIIPIVELVIMDTSLVTRIAKSDIKFPQRLYINHCDKKEVKTKFYEKIMENAIKSTRYNLLTLLDTLNDIVKENTPAWKVKWRMKEYFKVKYNKVKTNVSGVTMTMLEPKEKYKENQKKNEKISNYNSKRFKKCEKWRNSNLKFYKKILKTINE